ncbi:MAG: hypothetical protein L0228_05620 [Planctomycetes bacterium]|nr:hypothetical protein [Planctomycetota bacterium]
MSLPESNSDQPRGVLVRRPTTTIFTVLLFIALMALAIGCAIMAWEMLQYDLQYKPPANLRSATLPVLTHNLLV